MTIKFHTPRDLIEASVRSKGTQTPLVEVIRGLMAERITGPGKELDDGFSILSQNFPPHQLEDKETIVKILTKAPDFHCDVFYEGGVPVGVMSWRATYPVGIFYAIIAVNQQLQNRRGMGTKINKLVLELMKKEAWGADTVIFGEVQPPHKTLDDPMRDIVRPKFHDEKSLLRPAEKLEYLLPDLQQTSDSAERMLLCFRTIGGAIESISSKKVAEVLHFLYIGYYHRLVGIPCECILPLFQNAVRSLTGREMTKEEIENREILVGNTKEEQIRLKKIREMAE